MMTQDMRVDRRILQEAETLHAAGHEVILLAWWAEGHPYHERMGNVKVERVTELRAAPLEERTIQYIQGRIQNAFARLMAPAGRLPLFGWAVWLLRRIRSLPTDYGAAFVRRACFYRADLLHVHDLPLLEAGVYAKRALNVPLIYDAHELYPEIHTLAPARQNALTRLEARYIKACDQVITVNPLLAEEMARRYNTPLPNVIYNAIDRPADLDPMHPPDLLRQHFGLPPEARILLYQGWFALTRGLQTLIRAMPQVAEDVHVICMGYGDEGREAFAQLADELGVSERVHFKDAVPHTELVRWTASADAGIIPYPPIDLNHKLCSPNKLFEFIQAGVPIVANDLPFLRQVVDGEGFGVVMELDSPENFARAIANMFDEPGGPARFKPTLIEKAAPYSWQAQEKTLLALYEPWVN